MPDYHISATVSDSRIDVVRKKLSELFPNSNVRTEKVNKAPSRADRLDEASSLIEQAKSIVEELRDEIQAWFDNMPENLQGGDKGSEVEQCAQELSDICDSLDGADCGNVSFPGMY